MINLGSAARHLRERLQLSQRRAAKELGISHVHLSNIENGHTSPTASMIEKYYVAWGVDLYMLAVVQFSDENRLPACMEKVISDLHESWDAEIEEAIAARTREEISSCSEFSD